MPTTVILEQPTIPLEQQAIIFEAERQKYKTAYPMKSMLGLAASVLTLIPFSACSTYFFNATLAFSRNRTGANILNHDSSCMPSIGYESPCPKNYLVQSDWFCASAPSSATSLSLPYFVLYFVFILLSFYLFNKEKDCAKKTDEERLPLVAQGPAKRSLVFQKLMAAVLAAVSIAMTAGFFQLLNSKAQKCGEIMGCLDFCNNPSAKLSDVSNIPEIAYEVIAIVLMGCVSAFLLWFSQNAAQKKQPSFLINGNDILLGIQFPNNQELINSSANSRR